MNVPTKRTQRSLLTYTPNNTSPVPLHRLIMSTATAGTFGGFDGVIPADTHMYFPYLNTLPERNLPLFYLPERPLPCRQLPPKKRYLRMNGACCSPCPALENLDDASPKSKDSLHSHSQKSVSPQLPSKSLFLETNDMHEEEEDLLAKNDAMSPFFALSDDSNMLDVPSVIYVPNNITYDDDDDDDNNDVSILYDDISISKESSRSCHHLRKRKQRETSNEDHLSVATPMWLRASPFLHIDDASSSSSSSLDESNLLVNESNEPESIPHQKKLSNSRRRLKKQRRCRQFEDSSNEYNLWVKSPDDLSEAASSIGENDSEVYGYSLYESCYPQRQRSFS